MHSRDRAVGRDMNQTSQETRAIDLEMTCLLVSRTELVSVYWKLKL